MAAVNPTTGNLPGGRVQPLLLINGCDQLDVVMAMRIWRETRGVGEVQRRVEADGVFASLDTTYFCLAR